MKSSSVGSSLWSLAFAIGAFALLTITESFVTARNARSSSPQAAVAISRDGPGQPADAGVRADVREGVQDAHQRARR